jgi:hypothetical protein
MSSTYSQDDLFCSCAICHCDADNSSCYCFRIVLEPHRLATTRFFYLSPNLDLTLFTLIHITSTRIDYDRTGFQSKELIIQAGLNLGDVDQHVRLDVTIDGADE